MLRGSALRVHSITGWWWEVLCFAVYLALAASQLFMRPVIGLADNGDFPKVLAHLDVCDPDHDRHVLQYVNPTYVINAKCYWDGHLASSETLFARLLKLFAQWSGRTSIHITSAGKAHLAVVLLSWIILLWALHATTPVFRFGMPPLVILIFSDVEYVSYLNSFYMDAASMVFLLLTASLAVAALLRPRVWIAIAFGIAGVLLALSKTQHVVTAVLFGCLAAWFSVRGFRAAWTASAVAILTAAALTITLTPPDYEAEPLYSLIFYIVLPSSHDPPSTLTELGLPAADLHLAGTHAYSPGSPITTPAFREDFIHQVSYANLAMYYLRHPTVPLRLLGRGLTYFAPSMRPGDLANYELEDGFPPHTLAQRFALWSHLRAWSMFEFPAQMVIFYGIMGLGALLCLMRASWADRWPLYPLVLTLAVAGTAEFHFAVLLDATETARHLFFFHVITEILIVCAAGLAFSAFDNRP